MASPIELHFLVNTVYPISYSVALLVFLQARYIVVRVHCAVGPTEMKLFKIKAFLTYVSYVTILIMRNMRAQQLKFSKMASVQDPCIIYFKERKCFWSDNKYVSMKYISLNKYWRD